MAVSDRIQAEARRTIDGMQRFYDKYSDDADDAEELEHRIAMVEASMEGCNGLTQEEKIQKTAENVFELTCAQARAYDAMRMALWKERQEWKKMFNEMREQDSREFESLRSDIKEGLDGVMKKIEDSGIDCSSSIRWKKREHRHLITQLISDHPVLAFNAFVFVLVLVFVSGRFDDIIKLCGGS